MNDKFFKQMWNRFLNGLNSFFLELIISCLISFYFSVRDSVLKVQFHIPATIRQNIVPEKPLPHTLVQL